VTTFAILLSADNARGDKPDERIGLVLLERTLLDPPRAAATARWCARVKQRFPAARLVPYVWHLVSHASEDGLRERSTRRPAGDDHAFGGLQPTPEVQRAWEVTRLAAQACGASEIVLRTPPSLTPGGLGRKRIREFVAARASEGLATIWEPEGLWEPADALAFAGELGITALVPAFEGGRPRSTEPGGATLVGAAAMLRVDGTGPRARVDARQVDALAEHLEVHPSTTVVFAGPRALANLGELERELG
jgi:hypothetical protein